MDSNRGIVVPIVVVVLCLLPCVAAADPFGTLWVYYQEPLEPGIQDARIDLSLYLPKGYELFDVRILFLPEAPLSTDANATIVGRMGEATSTVATFYLDVNETAEPGIYEIPVTIGYATVEGGTPSSVDRTIQVRVEEVIEPEDPFGYLGVVTMPSPLVPGLSGAQIVLSLPYTGDGSLYDVSLSLGVADPFSTSSASFFLGVVSSGSTGLAVFYLNVDRGAVAGEYVLPLSIRYRMTPDGDLKSTQRVAKLFVAGEVVDPFGSLGVVTVPSVLVPGLRGVEVRVSVPYLGGLVDRLYDVSLSLGVVDPFSTLNASYYLGVVSPQSPLGPTPTAVFYLDIAKSAAARVYQIPVAITYATSEGGPSFLVNRTVPINIQEAIEAVDPFGSLIVSTTPSYLVSGMEGVEVKLSLPYIGIDERIYDVSMFLGVDYPFHTMNRSYYVGMMTVQSPVADIPFGIMYLDIDRAAVAGEYDLPLSIRYRITADGGFRLATKVVKLFVAGEVVDPFGSLGVVTVPSVLVPGLRGVEVRVSVPYLGGLVDRLYDVSLSLGVVDPFSTLNASYYLGVVSPQSPLGPTPTAVLYLNVADSAEAGEYDLPLSIRYRLARDGGLKSCTKSVRLSVAGEVVDPFGSLGVVTVPSVLVPGLRGVEVRVSVPYLGGLVDRLYDVSLSLDVNSPFSSANRSFHLGVMVPQSPLGPTPTAVFYLDVAESAAPGEFDLAVSIQYRLTGEGDLNSATRSVKLEVVDPEPVWVVRSLTDRLRPGSRDVVSLLLENKGGLARSVTAQFIPEATAYAKPEEGTLFLGDFAANETKRLDFPVFVDSGISGKQLVTIGVEYSTASGRIRESHTLTLRIGELLGSSLVVTEVKLAPEPRIGGEFEAVLKVENVGPEAAEAALIDLGLPPSLVVLGSGSTLSLGTLSAGQSATVRIRLNVDSSATEGTNEEVRYALKWSNAEGETFSRDGRFGVTLVGTPEVVIQRIDVDPPKLESRTKGTFQVTVKNTGTQLVSDIVVQLLGSPELFTETVLPIGSLSAKQADSVVFGLFVDPELEGGTHAITVLVTYTDASGTKHEEQTLVDLRIYRKKPIFSLVNLAIIGGVIVVIVVIYLLFGDSFGATVNGERRRVGGG